MGSKPKNKMPVADRAKQFMPFASLRGLPEALAAREKVLVPRIELSPEMSEYLDRKMHLLSKGSIVSVVYFRRGEYIRLTGMVARIDLTCHILQIVNTKISFADILDVNFI